MQKFSFKKVHLKTVHIYKMLAILFRPQCARLILGLRLANERRRYVVSHWLGANLESALNVQKIMKIP